MPDRGQFSEPKVRRLLRIWSWRRARQQRREQEFEEIRVAAGKTRDMLALSISIVIFAMIAGALYLIWVYWRARTTGQIE
jgi:hypothetical protein